MPDLSGTGVLCVVAAAIGCMCMCLLLLCVGDGLKMKLNVDHSYLKQVKRNIYNFVD